MIHDSSINLLSQNIQERGKFREHHHGIHPLTGTSVKTISLALSQARDLDNSGSLFWAVFCVLLRLRFGDFEYGRKSKLSQLKKECPDDVVFAYGSIFDFVFGRYLVRLEDVNNLFLNEGPDILLPSKFKKIVNDGFQGKVIVDCLSFIRENQPILPEIHHEEPEANVVLKIVLPVLFEAFRGSGSNCFYIYNDGLFYLVDIASSTVLEDYLERDVIYSIPNGSLVLAGQKFDFIALLHDDPSEHILQSCDDVSKLQELLFASDKSNAEISSNKDESAQMSLFAEKDSPETQSDTSDISNSDLIESLEKVLTSLKSEYMTLKSRLEDSNSSLARFDEEIAEEEIRHSEKINHLKSVRSAEFNLNQELNSKLNTLKEKLAKLGFEL